MRTPNGAIAPSALGFRRWRRHEIVPIAARELRTHARTPDSSPSERSPMPMAPSPPASGEIRTGRPGRRPPTAPSRPRRQA